MYKVIIIDDNQNDLNMMKNKIINCNKLELECFQDVSKIDMNKNYDAVFIDIDMPMMNGIDFANQYKLKHLDTFIIFVTNHSELVFDTFKVHPFDFIRKEHFDLEIERVIEELIFLLDKKNKKIQKTFEPQYRYAHLRSYFYLCNHLCDTVFSDRPHRAL